MNLLLPIASSFAAKHYCSEAFKLVQYTKYCNLVISKKLKAALRGYNLSHSYEIITKKNV